MGLHHLSSVQMKSENGINKSNTWTQIALIIQLLIIISGFLLFPLTHFCCQLQAVNVKAWAFKENFVIYLE